MTALDFPNSPSTNDTFTSGGVSWRYDGTKWGLDGYASGPTYETSLPGSPTDGQEIYYAADAANGVIWHLRYRSGGGTYKWEFVGGSALSAAADNAREVVNQTSYVDVPTDTITVTLPLAGEYTVEHNSNIYVAGGTGRSSYSGLAITNASNTVQTEATDDRALNIENPGTSTLITSSSTRYTLTITTAGWKLRERMRSGGNYTAGTRWRRIVVTPIRVG